MNDQAERHLSKAEGYLAKGEEFYRKAAEEIRAAKDAGATWIEIGDQLDRSSSWLKTIVTWAEDPANRGLRATPYGGEKYAEKQAANHARRVLRDAPLEQVEQIIGELPPERQRAVAASAGHKYLSARQDLAEEEHRRTPAERKEREAAGQAITEAGRKATAGFLSLGIAGHLEQATEELREIVADSSITPGNLEPITNALRNFLSEYEVACAMAGLESDLQVTT